jgi:GalNAc-alpha-(1->4)-GalNAc-alpha-(1->3)-diNAcBac-PP-undecaprenol alpha-1,4-N-acetyl-D-galactosaminyltransferase
VSSASGHLRLTLVISDLISGGAERVLTILANEWAVAGHSVRFVVQFGKPGEPSFYSLRPEIEVQRLDFLGIGERSLPKLGKVNQIAAMRRAILAGRPDIVVSFMDTVNIRAMLATIGTNIPVIVAEHCDPTVRMLTAGWTALRRWAYPRAAALILLTESAIDFFPPAVRRHSYVIPNPVVPGPPTGLSEPAWVDSRTIVALGRLNEIKGFDRLIVAFGAVAKQHKDWSLCIWGEGQERPNLERQIREAGLTDRVFLKGETTEPYVKLRAAEIFAMTSHTEGFPMALGEAMATGLACVSFDCPSGPRQLIRHGVDGWLVENGNTEAFATALSDLMADRSRREQFGVRALEVTDRFSLRRILPMWNVVFEEALKTGRR